MTWAGVAGKRVVITGATRGIGLAAARELSRRGALLTITARDPGRGSAAAKSIGGDVDVISVELASLASVRTLAAELLERYERIDVLANNAGAVNGTRRLTGDGLETTWQVNHLAPFLLTTLLLDRLRASAPARVVTTASDAHQGRRGSPSTTWPASAATGRSGWAATARPSSPTSSSRASSRGASQGRASRRTASIPASSTQASTTTTAR